MNNLCNNLHDRDIDKLYTLEEIFRQPALKRELESVARELILFYVWFRIYLLRVGCLERRKVRFFSPSCVQESVLPPWIFLAFYFLVRI